MNSLSVYSRAARTELVSKEGSAAYTVAFDDVDRKGRRHGAEVRTSEHTYRDLTEEAEAALTCPYTYCNVIAGHYFTVIVQALKDGKGWGPRQPRKYFATYADRDAYITKRLADMRNRAATGK